MIPTLLVILSLLTGTIIGLIIGYTKGVSDTEQRWSEAVGRADDARKQAAYIKDLL